LIGDVVEPFKQLLRLLLAGDLAVFSWGASIITGASSRGCTSKSGVCVNSLTTVIILTPTPLGVSILAREAMVYIKSDNFV